MDTERTFIRSLWLQGVGGTDMGTEALEKIFLYWLCHLPDAGALQIRRIGEAAGGFQQAYYIEGTQLWKKGIFKKEENALRFDAWKG